MPKIKNKIYRKFMDTGEFEPITIDDLETAFSNMKTDRNPNLSKAFLITLYYTGARPNEVLNIRAKDITKKGVWVIVQTPASKGGLTRKIYLHTKNKYVTYLYNYASVLHDDMYLFWRLRSKTKKQYMTKKGVREITEVSSKLRYYINKWFNGKYNPYLFRHSRFSQLAENGADTWDIKNIKGCKSMDSIMPYIHLSSKIGKRVGYKIK